MLLVLLSMLLAPLFHSIPPLSLPSSSGSARGLAGACQLVLAGGVKGMFGCCGQQPASEALQPIDTSQSWQSDTITGSCGNKTPLASLRRLLLLGTLQLPSMRVPPAQFALCSRLQDLIDRVTTSTVPAFFFVSFLLLLFVVVAFYTFCFCNCC